MTQTVTPRGRRRTGQAPGTPPSKKVHVAVRAEPELAAVLDEAARRSNRSRAQEVEARLRASFEPQGSFERALDDAYGPQIAGVLLMLGKAMAEIANVKNDWFDDRRFFEQAVAAINVILCGLAPKEEPRQLDILEETPGERELISSLGWDIGGWILVRAKGLPRYVGAPGSWPALVGERLGYDVRSRIVLPNKLDRAPSRGGRSPPTPAAGNQPLGEPDMMVLGEIVEAVEGKDSRTASRARDKVSEKVAKRQT